MAAVVGMLRAISMAKVGPESAAKRISRSADMASSNATWLIRAKVSVSIPLVAETSCTGRSPEWALRKSRSTSRKPCEGGARRTMSLSTTELMSAVGSQPGGSGTSRYSRLIRSAAMRSASSASRAHSRTRWPPAPARVMASAVPNEPAPRTAMFFESPFILFSLSSFSLSAGLPFPEPRLDALQQPPQVGPVLDHHDEGDRRRGGDQPGILVRDPAEALAGPGEERKRRRRRHRAEGDIALPIDDEHEHQQGEQHGGRRERAHGARRCRHPFAATEAEEDRKDVPQHHRHRRRADHRRRRRQQPRADHRHHTLEDVEQEHQGGRPLA